MVNNFKIIKKVFAINTIKENLICLIRVLNYVSQHASHLSVWFSFIGQTREKYILLFYVG